ncbi:MAG TPA: hypothetical protein PLY97_08520, partial [Acidocella sp.]|nr:hypothetical protein [Acidocella sp.]
MIRPSYAGVAGLGYGFGNGVRVALDGNYYRNTLHKANVVTAGVGQNITHGNINTCGPMVNVLYDSNIKLTVFPYVGAGVCCQWNQLAHRVNDGGCYFIISGTQVSFAYDVIAVLSYPLPWVSGLSATAEYRLIQLTQSRNYTLAYSASGRTTSKLGEKSSHTCLIGLRYQLFNPPIIGPAPLQLQDPGDDNAGRFGLHRHLRHSGLQPGPVAAPRQAGCRSARDRRRSGFGNRDP